jgi:Ca-activated chloride channel homolog
MHRCLPVLSLMLLGASTAQGRGLLIPQDKSLPPLAMLNHRVEVTIEDQAAVTRVEQTFRNHTSRALEATYLFPVPRGAGVNDFTMWVGDRKVKGELVEAKQARSVYTSIVRRTQDPGLLEFVGSNLLRMRVFPVPAHGDQKVSLSYTSVTPRDSGLIEYLYPLKTDGKAASTLEEFSIRVTIKSAHGIQNVYSPSHAVAVKRTSDRNVVAHFEQKGAVLDRDFQLFYQLGDRDVGLTALTHRPDATENGAFLMLIAPQLKMAKENRAPRDLVFVLDTSGSMAGEKIKQARNALKHCLSKLPKGDRFGLIAFATTVNRYKDGLVEVTPETIKQAQKWVDGLDATGGTAINNALQSALELRPEKEDSRTFTVTFFTDGLPTIGESNPETILKNTLAKNTAGTRIFTFGVGDDVNATLLDRLAYKTRARPTYVRPQEDIEVKVSSLYTKISHPVLTNLKLTNTGDVRLLDIYPPQLPDLFHGSQLVILGRFSGKGPAAIKLTGNIGKETREFVYELTFPEKTSEKDSKDFVEQLWARRKVGYLLDQIRASGEKKELVDEVLKLARRYGIATPYTSYLVVPDEKALRLPAAQTAPALNVPRVNFDMPRVGFGGQFGGGQFGQFGGQFGQFGALGGQFGLAGGGVGLGGGLGGAPAVPGGGVPFGGGFGRGVGGPAVPGGGGVGFGGGFGQFGQFGIGGGQFGLVGGMPAPTYAAVATTPAKGGKPSKTPTPEATLKVLAFAQAVCKAGLDTNSVTVLAPGKAEQAEAFRRLTLYMQARQALSQGQKAAVQSGQLGVDLSVELGKLRDLRRLGTLARKKVADHVCQWIGGVWIDTAFKEKTPALVIKAQSDAYFRLLDRHPDLKDVLRLGNRLVWMTPSGTALVVDPDDGKDKLPDADIDRLFAVKK